jgi:alpha-L-rhamnosidase
LPQDGQPAWIQFEFSQPFTARAFSLAVSSTSMFGSSVPLGRVEASTDGKSYRTLVALPGEEHNIRPLNVRTFALPETTARFYRVVFTAPSFGMRGYGRPANLVIAAPKSGQVPVAGPQGNPIFGQSRPTHYTITELVFHSGARVNRWEDKASFAPLFEFGSLTTPAVPTDTAFHRDSMVNLTSQMAADGSLHWSVPPGKWTIFRMGYSLTGAKNNPAVPASQGFEVDKLNRKYVEAYFHGYTDPISQALGPLFGKSLRYLLMDSYEANSQNWTDNILSEFRTRRGYDPTPYLPVLAGQVVESAEVSDRFLWDFRRTCADLFAEEHYGTMVDLLHQHGMGLYAEAAGISLPINEDTLLTKKYVDIPMGEFWVRAAGWVPPVPAVPYLGVDNRQNDYWADVRGAASAAHVYGKPFVAAESFTGGNYEAPALLKWMADYWSAQGVNRFVVHTSAHQPLDTKPGNTMVGTHFHRNITWAESAGPFVTYLARNSFLLQQGSFVGDIAYYVGESVPAAIPYWEKVKPEPPEGYDYDFVNTDILLNRMSVREGRLVLPSGTSYRVLVLPETDRMTLPVLRKIGNLISQGATVVGPKPTKSPSLADSPSADREVAKEASEIWGGTDGRTMTQGNYGQGHVFWGLSLADVLALEGVPRDVEYNHPSPDTLLVSIHRRTGDTDIYFISNQRDRAEDVQVRLRVNGKMPELWHSDTGAIEPVIYETADGRTTVPLHLEAREAVFVVFRQPAAQPSRSLPHLMMTRVATVSGPWEVSFPPNLGAPSRIQLDQLSSWTTHSEEGVKYFSGTATYTKEVPASQEWFRAGTKIFLDLGTAADVAEVSINGQQLGLVWKAPYRVEATQALKPGPNRIEIKVTNEWTNRILGDQLSPPEKRILAAAPILRGFGGMGGGPPTPLVSGLLGPVTISLRMAHEASLTR